jgi:signal transduction histidine kinase
MQDAPDYPGPRKSNTRRFRLGFGAMVALLLVVAFEAYRIQESASRQTDEIYHKHVRAAEAMWSLRRLIYLGSISARDYFLSGAPDRKAVFRGQYEQLRAESAGILGELERSLGAGRRSADLRARVEEFWAAVEATIQAPAPPRGEEAFGFVQSEIVPRRTAAGVLFRELAEANERAMRDGEAAFAGSRRGALYRLFAMVGLCVAVALAIARLSLRHAARAELESRLRFEEVAQARRDLQHLSARLLQIQEDERTRLSRELHDEIGQTLTALRIEISRALADWRSRSPAIETRLEEARLLAEKTVATVRDISALLRPSLLDDLGLEPALQSLVEDFSRRSGMRCVLAGDGLDDNLPDAHRTCVYRVVQEALTNCAKHSSATHVEIRVGQAGGQLRLEASDNGKGFSLDAHVIAGLGILGMRERVAALGGELSIESAPGEGTRLWVRLPLEHGGKT